MSGRLKSVGAHDPEDGGHTIVFSLTTAEGRTDYRCGDEDMSKVVIALKKAAQDAQDARQSGPFASMLEDTIAAPFEVRNVRSAIAADSGVVLEVSTQEGVPLYLSMLPDQARKMIEQLEWALHQVPPRAHGH